MHDSRFDRILDFLCSDIMSKRERENVRDELYDHLMTKYEINLAVGMDEEKAADEAINALGNRALLRQNLSKVHSYFPALSLKKGMTLLIAGYIFMSFHINFFEGMQQITTFIGSVIFLTGLFAFRTADKNLKVSFFTTLFSEFVSVFIYAVNPLWGDIQTFNIIFAVFSMLLNVAGWFFLYRGLRILTEPYAEQSNKPLRFGICTFISCAFPFFGTVLSLVMTRGMNTNYNVTLDEWGVLVFPAMAVMLIGIIMPLQLFLRVNKLLYASDHEYKVEDSSAKKAGFAFALIAVAVLSVIGGDFAYSMQKAETEPYSIEDFEMDNEEYFKICDGLSSYGIPQNLIERLPKSEIANFRGIVNADNLTESENITVDAPFDEYGYRTVNDREYRYVIETYIVRIRRGEKMLARALKRYTIAELHDSPEVNYYVDGISYLSNSQNNALTPYVPEYKYDGEDWIYNNDFLLILSEENGMLYKNEPLKVYNRSDMDVGVFPFRGIAGFEYEAKEGLEIIFATSYEVLQYEAMSQTKLEKLIHRSSPIVLQKRTAKELMCFEETAHGYSVPGYDDYIVSTFFSIPLIESEERNEEYYDETSDIYAYDNTAELVPSSEYNIDF